ncbi:30S ribosomal protein S9 [Limibacter armeniacum]|uniref:30S ribosomal protein S9 n=1 Tax=Limibacter armeniacum TaxID=466084 RepID=UPI002FE5BC4B
MEVINTSGRRKTSVARIYLTQGEGKITVNKKDLADYFPSEILRTIVNQPLDLTNEAGKYDIKVNVQGGGINGQAEAVRLAISKAICEVNAEHRLVLKPEGLLTRNPKMVERKKPGRRKARRRFQFSKR